MNHDIFWKNLTPKTTNLSPELKQAVEATYGDFETFKKTLITTTTAVQGSGWGWLGYNKLTESLHITTCANQDPLQGTTGKIFEVRYTFLDYFLTTFTSRSDSIARH